MKQAMRFAGPGKSPGPDGIPVELWRLNRGATATLLSRLFTAVGTLRRLPVGFSDGAVVALPKPGGGDATAISNYRPITLLNSDYRLLAQVLAFRFGTAMAPAVSREQTAYLPARRMSDSVHALQLMRPALAAVRHAGAAVAFLDFRKAFDTVDRGFLLEAMSVVGARNGMCAWARLLLHDTRAVAVINGHVSQPRVWEAGVRQGCPLSPLLYLFVAWALTAWLHACRAVGVQLPMGRVVGVQYADDTSPLLSSMAPPVVRSFIEHMAEFEAATGQGLNLSKCALLPLDPDPLAGELTPGDRVLAEAAFADELAALRGRPLVFAGPEHQVAGLRVVRSARTLGVVFGTLRDTHAQRAAEWDSRVAAVRAVACKLARVGLTVFGRAFASSGYGVSKLLLTAEHDVVPPHVPLALRSISAALVDRGEAPRLPGAPARRPRFPGVPTALLAGHPAGGGFGLLPWVEHIQARLAVAGLRVMRLLCGLGPWAMGFPLAAPDVAGVDCPSPVAVLAGTVLWNWCRVVHPAFAVLQFACGTRAEVAAGHLCGLLRGHGSAPLSAELPHGPLRRMAVALQALGPPSLAPPPDADLWEGDQPLAPVLPSGPWVWHMPLWGNPLLCFERRVAQQPHAPHAALGVLLESERRWYPEWAGSGFELLAALPWRLHTVADLVRLRGLLERSAVFSHWVRHRERFEPGGPAWEAAVWGPGGAAAARLAAECFHPEAPACMQTPGRLLDGIHAMCECLPTVWREAIDLPLPALAHAVAPPLPVVPPLPDGGCTAVVEVLQQLGWLLPARHDDEPPCWRSVYELTVADATLILMGQERVPQRQSAQRQYAAAAQLQLGGARPGVARACLQRSLAALWPVECGNQYKEVLWRMSVLGLPGAGGHGIVRAQRCPCGRQLPGPPPRGAPALARTAASCCHLRHGMWECPVAQAVVRALSAVLQRAFPGWQGPLATRHVWLLQPPAGCPGLRACVWELVCALALTSIDKGRRFMWARWRELQDGRPRLRQLTLMEAWRRVPLPPQPPSLVVRSSRMAVADLWCSVRDVAACTPVVPKSWARGRPGHPFFELVPASPRRLKLRSTLPPDLVRRLDF
ncbi:MAG: reverse transcriptase family protein [Roseomonas sp.]|nr:reverse transcriptase family protein [Roseomonas sp.]